MKDNRNKWKFVDHPLKSALTPSDVRYWKETMASLLKVGLEFEFNLPDKLGDCVGDNVGCACAHMDTGCWKKCEHEEDCRNTHNMETCLNRSHNCRNTDCEQCNNYKFSCLGVSCSEFTSICFNVCRSYTKNCQECHHRYDPQKDPKIIRNNLTEKFKPTNDYTKKNKSGVVSVTKDGSLKGNGGIEIITVGRRLDYHEFYNMSKSILESANECGAYLNERCGSHMHLLTTYYRDKHDGKLITELEKTIPEVVLSNFHQLCRRYQNAITWMTMALDKPHHMTRWEKFRVSILGTSAINRNMIGLQNEVSKNSGGRKYGWVNYNEMKFNEQGDVTAFHIEMRGADSTMCPSYYAAIACLYVALIIKAVEISRYGVLHISDEDGKWLQKAYSAKDAILNNMGDYNGPRVANTKNAMYFRDYYTEEGLDMLSQLKGILMKFGPAYDVLTKLVYKPPALRRCEGESWSDIEKSLEVPMSESNKLDSRLQEIIDLRLLEECDSLEEWVEGATTLLIEEWAHEVGEITKDEVQNFTELKMRDGLVLWSNSIGGVISV